MDKDLYHKVELMQNLLVGRATGSPFDDLEYQALRTELLNSHIKDKLPAFLLTNRSIEHFWHFIKRKFSSYEERRFYLWENFSPVLALLEKKSSPVEHSVEKKLKAVDEDYIHHEWTKAINRLRNDPEGTITSSRTLLETVCKFVLDRVGVTYPDDLELPRLYKLTAQNLNLAPEQHNEMIFKQILGGCQSVVEGLGSLRNKLSDSHGKRTTQIRAGVRHAELAVNLAGSMSLFLLQTLEEKQG